MRHLVLLLPLVLAGCAAGPVTPEPIPASIPVARPPQVRSSILGLTATELVGHFGNPTLQVREGVGLKLQFRSPRCVLDAYLYPSETAGSRIERVTYVDARLPSGAATDQAACIGALENPS